MTPDEALDRLTERFGIVSSYRDLSGVQRSTSRDTRLALLRANGIELDNDAGVFDALKAQSAADEARILAEEIVGRSGEACCIAAPDGCTWRVVTEGDNAVFAEGRSRGGIELPPLTPGIHDLIIERGTRSEVVRLIMAPKTAPSVIDVAGRTRVWGVNAALYGLYSTRNPAVGDYEDLVRAAEAFAGHGADFIGINPVHAIGWNSPEVISPYSPSHRGFLNTAHLAVDQIDPCSEASQRQISAWRERAAGNHGSLVDYAANAQYHLPILRSLYKDFLQLAPEDLRAAFDTYCEESGYPLHRFALFESLSDIHGANWRNWPEGLRDCDKNDKDPTDGQAFHAWLQWHADRQLQGANQRARDAGMGLGLYLDLAVGSRRDGAEAWCERDSIASGVSIGAPPDHLSPAGQNWNLAAYSPRKMAASKYRALRTILAQMMRYCGVLRIDHVLGMNRSFWIPDDGAPGGYIKQPFEALLAIIRIEAQRTNTVVIGEDLGLVPEGFRQALSQSGIYSYSVLQYEKDENGVFCRPEKLRPKSLACFGTHDTPTLQGFLAGRDIDWWHKLGWIDEQEKQVAHRRRETETADLQSLTRGGPENAGEGMNLASRDWSGAIHTALAQSPVAMVSVQFDDVFGEIDAQNLPGTVDEHPNWRRRSTVSVDELAADERLRDVSRSMMKCGRCNRPDVKEESGT